jgi:hypothetical protein
MQGCTHGVFFPQEGFLPVQTFAFSISFIVIVQNIRFKGLEIKGGAYRWNEAALIMPPSGGKL